MFSRTNHDLNERHTGESEMIWKRELMLDAERILEVYAWDNNEPIYIYILNSFLYQAINEQNQIIFY